MEWLINIFEFIKEMLIYIFSFVFILSIPVFLHELGHFLAAISCGVKVEKFYIGFDFFGLGVNKKINGTEYGIGLFPLGGYVKLAGIIDENMDDSIKSISYEPEQQFKNKNLFQKIWILSAGVIMNFILSFIIFSLFAFFLGDSKPKTTPIVKTIMKEVKIYDKDWEEAIIDGPAYEAGLNPGDLLVKYSIRKPSESSNYISYDISDMNQLLNAIPELDDNESIKIYYKRSSFVQNKIEYIDTLAYCQIDDSIYQSLEKNQDLYSDINQTSWFKPIKTMPSDILGNKRIIGMGYDSDPVNLGLFGSIAKGAMDTINIINVSAKSLYGLLSGEIPTKHLSGIIGIGKTAGDTAKSNAPILSLSLLMAFISANLGFINILPIPGLDGGHAFLETLQGIFRRQFSVKTKMKIQIFGMLLIFSLFLFSIFNDIKQIIFS